MPTGFILICMSNKLKLNKAFAWVSSLYFTEGFPYVVVMTLSVVMYKRLDVSNTDIALYTGWLYLPWVIKPFWGPLVDLFRTKRWWIVVMQLLMGAGFAGVAFSLSLPAFFQISLAFFWLLAFSSATNDIATDGFYMLSLDQKEQAFFVGIRSTFYRVGMVFAQGGLVILAGYLEGRLGNISLAWSWTFVGIAVVIVAMGLLHQLFLPRPAEDRQGEEFTFSRFTREFSDSFAAFFKKPGVGYALFFILTYRLGEAQLVKMISPFLLDKPADGGLGLTTTQIGLAYGTLGVVALIVGGILGGIAIAKGGLRRWIWPMAFALTLPNVLYFLMAYYQPSSLVFIYSSVMVEQFGYGFGFTSYMVYMMRFAEGKYATSHFAFCTGFMALGMMLPGMASGWIQEQIGYPLFFVWVTLCMIPSLFAISRLKL